MTASWVVTDTDIHALLDVFERCHPEAADDIFYVSAAMFIALIPLVWLSHPQRGAAGKEAAAGAH